jgi:hypothetical protein
MEVAGHAIGYREVLTLKAGARAIVPPRPKTVIQVSQPATAYVAPAPSESELGALMSKLTSLSGSERERFWYQNAHKAGVFDETFDDEVAERVYVATKENPFASYERYLAEFDARVAESGHEDSHDRTTDPDFYKHGLATDFAEAGELEELIESVHDYEVQGGSSVDSTKRREALERVAIAVHANVERKTCGRDKGLPKANPEAIAAAIDLAVRDICHQRLLKRPADIAKQAKVRYQALLAIKAEALKQIQRLGVTDVLREAG